MKNKNNNGKFSYTSEESEFPLKVLTHNEVIEKIIKDKTIFPIHLRINITNICNLACDWCCRGKIERTLEMEYETIADIVKRYKKLGCKAITISGGGEPLLHEKINDIISLISSEGIKIGILTNGWFVSNLNQESLDKITWIRVSLGDGRKTEKDTYWQNLKITINKSKNIDWGFSYVLTKYPDYYLINKTIDFANKNDFKHVRICNDIFLSKELEDITNSVKNYLKENKTPDDLVIYQTKTNYTNGDNKCVVGLIRPIIDTDGHIYSCCGVGDKDFDYNPTNSLGTINDIEKITEKQIYFNGSVCKKCYLHHYNKFLNIFLLNIEHSEFI